MRINKSLCTPPLPNLSYFPKVYEDMFPLKRSFMKERELIFPFEHEKTVAPEATVKI